MFLLCVLQNSVSIMSASTTSSSSTLSDRMGQMQLNTVLIRCGICDLELPNVEQREDHDHELHNKWVGDNDLNDEMLPYPLTVRGFLCNGCNINNGREAAVGKNEKVKFEGVGGVEKHLSHALRRAQWLRAPSNEGHLFNAFKRDPTVLATLHDDLQERLFEIIQRRADEEVRMQAMMQKAIEDSKAAEDHLADMARVLKRSIKERNNEACRFSNSCPGTPKEFCQIGSDTCEPEEKYCEEHEDGPEDDPDPFCTDCYQRCCNGCFAEPTDEGKCKDCKRGK